MPDLWHRVEKNMTDSKTFIKITNRDIYRKLCGIEAKFNSIKGTINYHNWAIGFIVLILIALIGCIL